VPDVDDLSSFGLPRRFLVRAAAFPLRATAAGALLVVLGHSEVGPGKIGSSEINVVSGLVRDGCKGGGLVFGQRVKVSAPLRELLVSAMKCLSKAIRMIPFSTHRVHSIR
jgi:hypothetical protein